MGLPIVPSSWCASPTPDSCDDAISRGPCGGGAPCRCARAGRAKSSYLQTVSSLGILLAVLDLRTRVAACLPFIAWAVRSDGAALRLGSPAFLATTPTSMQRRGCRGIPLVPEGVQRILHTRPYGARYRSVQARGTLLAIRTHRRAEGGRVPVNPGVSRMTRPHRDVGRRMGARCTPRSEYLRSRERATSLPEALIDLQQSGCDRRWVRR